MVSLPQGVLPWQSSLFKSGYSTTKSVRVYSWRVIVVYYGLCMTVAVYVILYMMLWHRGYQKIDNLMGTVHTKIKGSATDAGNIDPVLAEQSWDAEDLVRYYTDGFFMPTRFQRTVQTQGKCSVAAKSHLKTLKGLWTEKCTKDGHECRAHTHTFHGLQTGTCITDGQVISEAAGGDGGSGLIGVCKGGALDGASCYGADDDTTCDEGGGTCEGAFCELRAWCPVEGTDANATKTVELDGWEKFSVFARVDTIFPQFGEQHNNLRQAAGKQGLCPLALMDKGKCVAANLFTVSDVLERAQISPLEAADHGAEILVKVKWADMKPMLGSKGKYPCNLDQADWRESCTPSFDFIRLDDPDPHSFSHGYNFRESTADGDVGAAQRVLTKWIGIRVILMIEGQGGRFDGITTMQHIGAGLALMSIATLIADAMICYLLSNEETALFRKRKYEDYDLAHEHLTAEERAVLSGERADPTLLVPKVVKERIPGVWGFGKTDRDKGYTEIPDPET